MVDGVTWADTICKSGTRRQHWKVCVDTRCAMKQSIAPGQPTSHHLCGVTVLLCAMCVWLYCDKWLAGGVWGGGRDILEGGWVWRGVGGGG